MAQAVTMLPEISQDHGNIDNLYIINADGRVMHGTKAWMGMVLTK